MLLFPVLIAMLLFESLVTLEDLTLPSWFLPSTTAHEVISILRRLFPAFMNGCRCILGAYYQDPIKLRETALREVTSASRAVALKFHSLTQSALLTAMYQEAKSLKDGAETTPGNSGRGDGIIGRALNDLSSRLDGSDEGVSFVKEKVQLCSDPDVLLKHHKEGWGLVWLRNLAIYVIALVIMSNYKSKQAAATKK